MRCDSGARCSVTPTRPDEGFWNLTHAAAAAAMLITKLSKCQPQISTTG